MAKLGSGCHAALICVFVQLYQLAVVSPTGLAISKRDLLDPFVPSSVCYVDLGCFSTGGNFYDAKTRPIQPLPSSPEQINPTFWLLTRSTVMDPKAIVYNDKESVTAARFDPQKPTKIICHGWTETTDLAWVGNMKRALLAYGDFNVIPVDWRLGSQTEYTHSVSNTRVVGALIARMVAWLEREFGANRETFHIIGHSLGSHVAGYAGAGLRESDARQLGRITGLDPAGPYFDNTHPEVRLDPTDARFVDVMHTDGTGPQINALVGMGMTLPMGHADFYPNGGTTQPGCSPGVVVTEILAKGIVQGTIDTVACDHGRVTHLFTATILNAAADFQAYECAGYEEFKAGRCLSCSANRCARMGIRADEWNPNGRVNVRFYSDTQAVAPFFMHHYSVTVKLASSGFNKEGGDLSVALAGEDGQATPVLALLSNGNMEPGQTVQGLVTSPAPVFNVARVSVTWRSNELFAWVTFFGVRKIGIGSVEVLEGYNQKTTLLCGNGATIDTGSMKTFGKC